MHYESENISERENLVFNIQIKGNREESNKKMILKKMYHKIKKLRIDRFRNKRYTVYIL